MKILTLGAAGFIGSHLTQRLLQEGHAVVAVDITRDKVTEYLDHPNLTFLQQDIRSPEWDLDRMVRDADLVIDLIAYANPGLYLRIPLEVFRLNFTENLKIAETCVRHSRRLVQFSTCEVYGRTAASLPNAQVADPDDPIHGTFSEDTSEYILGPVSKHRWIYSCAKQLLERVLHAYGLEQGFNYTIIRPFNFIGPKIDFLPQAKDDIPRVFSFFMEALLSGTPMKLVNGGVNRRCYTYIDDAVDCTYRIVENPGGVCDRQIFNIGSPYNEVSIRQMAEIMRDIYALQFRPDGAPLSEIISVPGEEFYGEGYDDSDRRIPDITKARTLLGWEPKWKFHDLLEATMRYYVNEVRQAPVPHLRSLMVNRVFVLMPAYNAAATLEGVFARVPAEALRRIERFVVVNDGSKDDTAGVLTRLEQRFSNLTVLTHPQNRGYGEAEKSLLRHALAEGAQVGIVLHSDGQYSPEKIPDLLAPFDRDTADLVQGSRMVGGGALQGGMPFYKFIANKALTAIENLSFGMKMAEYHSGYMLYSRKAMETIPFEKLSASFDFDLEMLVLAKVKGLRIAEVAIPTIYAGEKSHLNPIQYGFDVLSVVKDYRRGRYHAM